MERLTRSSSAMYVPLYSGLTYHVAACGAEVRQLLAHATQLLDASAAEPQWLRSGERPFQVAAWTKLVQSAQQVALRWVSTIMCGAVLQVPVHLLLT